MPDQREQSEIQNTGGSQDEMYRGESPESQNSGAEREASSTERSNRGSSNRGFAAMSPERQKQIASEGGRAAHRQGVAHEWNSDEARKAGRKGGEKVSQNREHMSAIGRRGGQSSGGRRNKNQQTESENRD
ncbi:MAG: KGG domain-containing protein [Flavisolibacter sp.]